MDKTYYNTVVSVTFSPCGNYFLAGNTRGDVALFDLSSLINNPDDNIQVNKNKFSLPQKTQIHSVTSSDQFLIIGLTGEIIGWKWQDILNSEMDKLPSSSWKIRIPSTGTENAVCEVNSLKIGSKSNVCGDILYAGCGDNNVHSFSLEDGQHIRTYSGHTDYVHNIDVKENLIVSASEDGSVIVNDSRTSELVNLIEPHRHDEIRRPFLGNWIGDVSLNEDWLVCGGGARLSLWNLRTTDCPMTIFTKTMDQGIHVVDIYQNDILAGGSAPHFSILSFNDELRTGIQSSSNVIYACAVSMKPNSHETLGLVGNSNNIDITTNFKYREYTVPFY